MKQSDQNPPADIEAPSRSTVVLRDPAYRELFNGSQAMLSVRESADELRAAGPRQAILTVHVTTDAQWMKTITIPSR